MTTTFSWPERIFWIVWLTLLFLIGWYIGGLFK